MGEFTFGKTVTDGSDSGANELNYHAYSTGGKTGRLKRMGLYVYDASGHKVKGAIYQGTNPKIAETPEWTVPGGAYQQTEIEFAPADRKIIEAGTYNLAIMMESGRILFDASPSGNLRWYARAYDGFPATLAAGAKINAFLTIWVVCDEVFASSAELSCAFEVGVSEDLLAKFEVGQDSADLLARFEVGQDSENLYAQFGVGQDSADLLGKIDITHSVDLLSKVDITHSVELLGEAEIQQSGSDDLLGKVDITHSVDLLCKVDITHSVDLLCKVDITHSVDLLCKVDITHSVDLLCKVDITHSVDLLGKADIRHSGSEALLGKADITHSVDLLCKVDITHSVELLGKVDITHSVDLLGKVDITHSVELFGKSVIRHSHHAELFSKFEVGQDSADLFSHFDVGQDAEELLVRAAIRHSASLDLKFSLYVSPWYLTVDEMLVGGRDRRMKIK